MTKIYACLLGNWVCLNDDPNCVIRDTGKDPQIWWEENAEVYAPTTRNPELQNSLYGLDYVNISYRGKDYRINPIFIQVVSE